MNSALLTAKINPNKDYFGIVEFYDSEFSSSQGRGRIKVYLGEEHKPFPFKLIEVFELGIKHSLQKTSDNKNMLSENELIRCKIVIGAYGFTAIDVIVLCMSSGLVKFEELAKRMDRNPTSYDTPFMARVRVKETEEELPKIIKVSQQDEVTYEQKT